VGGEGKEGWSASFSGEGGKRRGNNPWRETVHNYVEPRKSILHQEREKKGGKGQLYQGSMGGAGRRLKERKEKKRGYAAIIASPGGAHANKVWTRWGGEKKNGVL